MFKESQLLPTSEANENMATLIGVYRETEGYEGKKIGEISFTW